MADVTLALSGVQAAGRRIVPRLSAATAAMGSLLAALGGGDTLLLQFSASPDHDAVDPLTGEPLVSSYELRISDAATDTLQVTDNLGKPTPDGSGLISVSSSILNELDPGDYLARVVALGPHAEIASDEIAISAAAEFTV